MPGSHSDHPVLFAVDTPLQMQPTQGLKHRVILHMRRKQEDNFLTL